MEFGYGRFPCFLPSGYVVTLPSSFCLTGRSLLNYPRLPQLIRVGFFTRLLFLSLRFRALIYSKSFSRTVLEEFRLLPVASFCLNPYIPITSIRSLALRSNIFCLIGAIAALLLFSSLLSIISLNDISALIFVSC